MKTVGRPADQSEDFVQKFSASDTSRVERLVQDEKFRLLGQREDEGDLTLRALGKS